MKWYDKTIQKVKPDIKYSRQQLISMLREDAPMLNDGSFQWAIGGMLRTGEIIRTGFDEYMINDGNKLPEYKPSYTQFASELLETIAEKYPYIEFTVFESILMNDFLNHLIAQNTVFIQVEKDTSAFIFHFLKESGYGNVMYRPSKKDFNLYWEANCIVIADLISESPLSNSSPHEITIEKMLVDMYCDKLVHSTYSKAEYPSVMEHAIKTYKVEKPKMLRYARRRNKAGEIERIIAELS